MKVHQYDALFGTRADRRSVLKGAAAMAAVGVPVAPGYHGAEQSLERLRAEAERVGFPLIIKASAGGGGKGMQVVNSPAEVAAAIESAQRLAESLGDLRDVLGPQRPAVVARELTKLHEEVRRGALDALAAEYASEEAPRGEIVIVVGAAQARPPIADDVLDREIAELLANLSVRDAAAAVAAKHGLPRRQVYARALALAGAVR